MSQENVEAFKRAVDAYNRRDVEAALEEIDPELEFHSALQLMLGGEATVYRGHEGVRELVRDLDSAFAELQVGISEIRDLDERIVAIGPLRGRGKESGAQVEAPLGWMVEFKNGKMTRIRSSLDPKEALQAAGLQE